MRFIWLLLLILQAVYAGDKNEISTKQYLDLNNPEDSALIWESLFIKLNRVVEATQTFEQNFESINKRLDELSKRLNEQKRDLPTKPLDIGNINGAPKNQWTTILRRQDGSVDFNRNWNDYKNGFGNPDADFFIGLEMLHRLTSNGRPQELLVVLVDYENVTRFARYDRFRIGSEAEKYAITDLGSYSGDAGDGMGWHRGKKFTTFDQDNNAGKIRDCPQNFKGGWWFHDPCYSGHLHGPYRTKENSQTWGVSWDPWRKWNVSLKYAAMMIRDKMQTEQENHPTKAVDNKNGKEVPESQWTKILRRQDGSVDFNRNWMDYKLGFGNPDADFFIGLEMLHRLTSNGKPKELLIVLVDYENETRFARYDRFLVMLVMV
ncbi:angiopoietin-related protein 1-like [Musca vetustissima]|uniref:angiopoietin-related protein 1-like n=1 Tax=Musca vetustissima TaxID=27455 RepID=UPI002AB71774|nr:angiopoietin-related protein 1-like [Musca vetustissima]